MKQITGLLYFRRKRRLSRIQLAVMSDIEEITLKRMESYTAFCHPSHMYMRLAKCLNITVDDLVLTYPESLLEEGDQHTREARSPHPDNIIGRYKFINNLTFHQLAMRLGLKGKESARVVCKRKNAGNKHVETLARYHGISVEEFRHRYSNKSNEIE